jgi:hypothetical protein
MHNKLIAILIVLVLLVLFCGCGVLVKEAFEGGRGHSPYGGRGIGGGRGHSPYGGRGGGHGGGGYGRGGVLGPRGHYRAPRIYGPRIRHLPVATYTNYITTTPNHIAYYNDYQGEPIQVRFHYDDTQPAYQMWLPIWKRLREDMELTGAPIRFSEINENINSTPGIEKLPIIIKYRNGVAQEYTGDRHYPSLRNWVLAY